MKAILETEDLVKYYGEGENQVRAIDHTSMQVQHGEFVAVVGRSGSGKSTLLHMLGGLDRPDSGKVYIEGRDIFALKDEQLAVFRRRKIGFIFQDYNLMPALNVWENIVLPIGLDGKKVKKDFVLDIVKSIGMEDRLHAMPNQLSGGQKQRLSIARAIAKKPEIFIFDDSFSALDFKTDSTLRKALKEHTKDATTIIVAQRISTILNADKIIVLDDGHMAGIGTHGELMKNCEVYRQIAMSQLSEEELA